MFSRMLSMIARRSVAAFERRWNYDMSYAREMLDEGGFDALAPMNALGKIGRYRRDVPVDVYQAVKITTAIAADCGPCAQLHVSMAEADGVAPATLRALIAGDADALPPDAALGFAFARAVLAHENADDLRTEIRKRWGMRALASLGYAMIAAQSFPTMKAVLGHARACTRLHVAGVEERVPEHSHA